MLRSARTLQAMGGFCLGPKAQRYKLYPHTPSPQFRFETPPPAYTAEGQEGLKPLATPGMAPPYSEQGGSAIRDLIFGLIRYVEQTKHFR
jgi:hypothetical protein